MRRETTDSFQKAAYGKRSLLFRTTTLDSRNQEEKSCPFLMLNEYEAFGEEGIFDIISWFNDEVGKLYGNEDGRMLVELERRRDKSWRKWYEVCKTAWNEKEFQQSLFDSHHPFIFMPAGKFSNARNGSKIKFECHWQNDNASSC